MKAIVRILLKGLPALALAVPAGAHAELVLSQIVVDLAPGQPARQDIEAFNDGEEPLYVSAEPFEILDPGTEQQRREPATNPEQSGILVTPQKLVLEPGERRLIRIAATAPRGPIDRVYRVTIKPEAGDVSANTDALKVYVGYDALVLYRPEQITGQVDGQRSGTELVLTNRSNTAQELFEGEQCDASGRNCQALPARRLYPGVAWTQSLPYQTAVRYKVGIGNRISTVEF